MSSARGQANQQLYLARILLAAWRRDLEAAVLPDSVLRHAYLPGLREHLLGAYGWFLLEISGESDLSQTPPRSCADLTPLPAGKAEAGEIREFRQLEADGWLAGLVRPLAAAPVTAAHSRDNLAVSADALPGLEQAANWTEKLDSLFARMGDSLDEY